MNCNVSGDMQRNETSVRIEDQEIPQKDSFQYSGSIICKNGKIEEDVEHRVGWLK